jgi:TetR/AcrR family transcriptional repressor of nem operon
MLKPRCRPKAFNEDEAFQRAMNYFWEDGYDNTSLDILLVVMGIKKSCFYHTFKSKETLFTRCLDLYHRFLATEFLKLKQEIGPKETMLKITQMSLDELKQTGKVRGCLIMNSGQECYNKYSELSRQISIEFNFMQDLFVNFVKEAQEKGEITSKKEAHIISGRYFNTLNGLYVSIQAGARKELIDDIVENLKEILE